MFFDVNKSELLIVSGLDLILASRTEGKQIAFTIQLYVESLVDFIPRCLNQERFFFLLLYTHLTTLHHSVSY